MLSGTDLDEWWADVLPQFSERRDTAGGAADRVIHSNSRAGNASEASDGIPTVSFADVMAAL